MSSNSHLTENPDIYDLLQVFEESLLRDIHTAFPAKVQKFYKDKTRADLKPMVSGWVRDGDAAPVIERYPILPYVPIIWPRSGGWYMSMPVNPGDWVLVVICEAHVGHVLETGDDQGLGDLRRHSLSNAVAIPGLFSNTDTIATEDDGIVIGKKGGAAIKIHNDGTVRLGSVDASEFVGLASKINQCISSLKTFATTHTHPVPALGTSGASAVPVGPTPDVAATKTKAT